MNSFVPAHTSKIGYHVQSRAFTHDWDVRTVDWPALRFHVTRTYVTAVSNRAPLIESDGKSATNYYRKVGRLVSLSSPKVETSSHRFKAESSIGSRVFAMRLDPHGSPYGGSTVSVPDWMTDKVIQECISEINEVQALIMEDFFQAKQTVDMITDIFNLVLKLYLMARKRQWRKIRRLLRGMGHDPGRKAANGWLMYFYGILPLLSSISAICESYEPKVLTQVATRKARQPVGTDAFVDSGGAFTCTSGNAEQIAKCGLTVAVNVDSTVRQYKALGLGSHDLDALVVFWAITPYSFVFDWFIPVERFLSTRRWTSGISYQTGYVSKLLLCSARYQATNVMTGSGDFGTMPRVKFDCMQFQRIAYNNFTPPSGLALNLSLNPTQLVSALALLVQRR